MDIENNKPADCTVDWLGYALDLESLTGRVESQTVVRAMEAGAHCLRLMGEYLAASAAAPQVVADERTLPPLPEMASAADLAYVMQTPEDWDADYRSTWQKLQVEAHNKRQWRKYALELRAALAAAPVQARHPDDAAVDRFAAAMKDKMSASRAKGRGGWDDPAQCSIEKLAAMLCQHVEKGDPVDIANFAMMIHQRNGSAIDVYEALAVFMNSRSIVAPVQAQEPVAEFMGMAWSEEKGAYYPILSNLKFTNIPARTKLYAAPVQPVAVPVELRELQEKVSRYEVQMLRMAGCAGEFAKAACEMHTVILTDEDTKEKLKDLKRYFVSESVDDIYEHSKGDLCKFEDIKSMIGALGRPAAQGDAKDAERYRWLRAIGKDQQHVISFYAMKEMDKRIDAAIAAKAAS